MRVPYKVLSITALAALTAACASPAEQTSTVGEPTSSVVQGEASTTPTQEEGTTSGSAAAEESAEEETETEQAEAVLEVEDYGFTQQTGGDYSTPGVTYAVVFSNSGSAIATNAQFQISIENADGDVLDSEQGYVTAVLPDTSVAHAGYFFDIDGAEKMTVQLLPGDQEELDGEGANFEVSKISTKLQEYGGIKTTATVESPFTKDLENVEAVAVYRNGDDEIVGGDFTYVNFVPAGGTAAVSIDGMSWEGDAPAATEVYIALTGLSLME